MPSDSQCPLLVPVALVILRVLCSSKCTLDSLNIPILSRMTSTFGYIFVVLNSDHVLVSFMISGEFESHFVILSARIMIT